MRATDKSVRDSFRFAGLPPASLKCGPITPRPTLCADPRASGQHRLQELQGSADIGAEAQDLHAAAAVLAVAGFGRSCGCGRTRGCPQDKKEEAREHGQPRACGSAIAACGAGCTRDRNAYFGCVTDQRSGCSEEEEDKPAKGSIDGCIDDDQHHGPVVALEEEEQACGQARCTLEGT